MPRIDNVESFLNASSEEQIDGDNDEDETNDNNKEEENNYDGVSILALQAL